MKMRQNKKSNQHKNLYDYPLGYLKRHIVKT